MRYAGLMKRFLALVIDFALFSAVFFPITRIAKGVWIMSASDHRWSSGLFITDPLCFIFLAAIILYFVLMEAYLGVTLGKKIVGIRVAGIGGEKPGLTKSVVRNVLRAIDSLPALNILGVALILSSDENARLGDRLAGTRVVNIRKAIGKQ